MMPKKLEDCVKKVSAKGHDKSSAWAICQTSVMKKGGAKKKEKK